MNSKQSINEDKVVFDDLVKEFKVDDIEVFSNYLTEIWKDLARRSTEKWKGINRLTFSKYYGLPGIINDRLFSVFDSNHNDYWDPKEFLAGMTTLFSDNFDHVAQFIFNFYDFDRDGLITKEDVRVVLSYVPIQSRRYSKSNLKYEAEDFNDRVEAQDELFELLSKVFDKKEALNQEEFLNIIYNVNSDIFLFILIFLWEKRPFNKETIAIYEGALSLSPVQRGSKTPNTKKKEHIIMSPSQISKFKSPTLKQRRLNSIIPPAKGGWAPNQLLNLYSGKPSAPSKDTKNNSTQSGPSEKDKENIRMPHRRDRKHLDKLSDKTPPSASKNAGDTNLIPDQNNTSVSDSESDNDGINHYEQEEIAIHNLSHEGYMYKLTKTKKVKKLWFKLVCKDIYYFKTNEDKVHKGMHNLSGVFLKENGVTTINNSTFHSFSIIYPKQIRNYYWDNKTEYDSWLKYLRKAIDETPLAENYEIKETWGKGKFGLVKLGIHKQTHRKVAVKIINKKDMSNQDLELVKTEIDIWKISQHPNIIKLYDIFENPDAIYIIMEHCAGGDWFSYIEKRNYRLPESRTAEIIHKLSAAIYFIHSFGIVHRDLKPENILMTDTTEKADIRWLDFGLSKIIGPKEKCTEPYGTLSYVAPEVWIEKPYDQTVDLWSIGIVTYLLLCGCWPFDDEHSEREIARQTIHDPVPYHPSWWKNLSSEAKKFVNNWLQKAPEKRMSIKQVLEHEWIKKYYMKMTEERKKSVVDSASSFKLYASVSWNK